MIPDKYKIINIDENVSDINMVSNIITNGDKNGIY